MPPLELDENHAKYQIRAYQPGTILVNDKTLSCSIIVAEDQLIENWPPQSVTDLTPELLSFVIPLKPDVLLIGTGSKHTLLPIELYGELINQGIGVEIMDTSAACRTFNVLCAEHRKVVAALIIN